MANLNLPADGGQQDSESDDEEVVETSPCGRWEKHRKEVNQKNVPGIDSSFLAMDTEEGVEVVWNEVMFSERKSWRNKQETFKRIFENLTQLDHPNIVKFHKYWVDVKEDIPRLIFITEFMTSGSLKQFLNKTKINNKTMNIKAWKRWCRQILSALSYLHKCDPPIVHGNLNCDTIFIQHNGLMKIGTVAPDSIHSHVKTFKHDAKNMHFIAPEYDGESLFTALSSADYGLPGHPVNCAADIYSFGMVALEMAAIQLAEGASVGTPESVQLALSNLEDPKQADFISQCLNLSPMQRPTVDELLLHPVLLEVYSLRVQSGHSVVNYGINQPESLDDIFEGDRIIAEIKHSDGREPYLWKFSNLQPPELEKFLEEIRTGLYPLTGMSLSRKRVDNQPRFNRSRPKSPENADSQESPSPEPEEETRIITHMECIVRPMEDKENIYMTLLLKMDDKLIRQLTCEVLYGEKGIDLAEELVHYGFINIEDKIKIATLMEENLNRVA